MKFQFFVLQSSTGAGLALSRFLDAHPDVIMPSREACDEAFVASDEGRLLRDLSPDSAGRCRGFMLHHRVQLEPDVPKRVAALVEPSSIFVQLVRNPVDVIVASHRRYILAQVTDRLSRELGRSGVPDATPQVKSPEEIYEWLKPRLAYHEQGERFASTFGEWVLIDSSELWPKSVEVTMHDLYSKLGVNHKFTTPLFHKDFHGFATKMLHFSQQTIDVNGTQVLVRLERTPHVPHAPGDFTRELARVPAVCHRLSYPMEDTPLSLVMTESQWWDLPVAMRSGLAQPGAMQRFLEDQLLPQWIEHVESIHAEVTQRWQRELEPTLLRRLRDDLATDYHSMFWRWPELSDRWSWGSLEDAVSS